MRGHTNRSHARTAATMRNAERLVQIDVADIGAEFGGPAHADLRVQVRAVHINLAAVLMNDFAYFFDGLLKHTVR